MQNLGPLNSSLLLGRQIHLHPEQYYEKLTGFISLIRNATSQVVLVLKNPTCNAGDVRDMSLIPGSGRSPGGGNGNPLQCSCLENPMGR